MSYIYYKSKYLTLKKHLGGAVPKLDPEINSNIRNYTNCKEAIRLLSTKKQTDFSQLIFPINTTLNLVNPTRQVCNNIQNDFQRQNCNIYYNQCYLKNLFRKYFPGQLEPVTYNVETLNEIMLKTIPNNNNDQNKITEQNNLIVFGSTLTVIPESYAEIIEELEPNLYFHEDDEGNDLTFGSTLPANLQLINITIPNSVQTIGSRAFAGNNLQTITIPNSVQTIGNTSFSHNQLHTVTMGNSVITIGNSSFSHNQLQTVTIPNSVITIGNSSFSHNNLQTVTMGNSVQTIGFNAFSKNQLTEVIIPNSVQKIGTFSFADNKLQTIIIPNSVQTIDYQAFANNHQLQTVTIPEKFRPDIFRIFGRINIPNIIYT
jgi:hypothetical protein